MNSDVQRKKKKDYNVDKEIIYVINNDINVDTNNDSDSEEYNEELDNDVEDDDLDVGREIVFIAGM